MKVVTNKIKYLTYIVFIFFIIISLLSLIASQVLGHPITLSRFVDAIFKIELTTIGYLLLWSFCVMGYIHNATSTTKEQT